MINIRQYTDQDWPVIWAIIKPVFRAGETYAFASDICEDDARRVWIRAPLETYVLVDDANTILGTYFIKANQPGLGAHVCNCGYIVANEAQGKGIASQMCIHSQAIALELGFSAMQYNLVVASNVGAIYLWKKLGFKVVGTLPKAFKHANLGLVDALVMYKQLGSI